MSKVKILTISSIVLLLINLCLIGFLWFAPHRHHHQEPKYYIIQKLGFDANQVVSYEEIIKKHQAAVKVNDRQQIELKGKLYQGLIDDYKTINKDSLVNALANVQREVELVHVAHFFELKAICKQEQLPQFDALVAELGELFSRKIHPPKKK